MGFVLMMVIVWLFFSNGIVVKVFDKNLYLSSFFVWLLWICVENWFVFVVKINLL